MHPLTLLATGLYGRELPPQDGAPIRLVVPWKYGFKGIKSIVKISLGRRRSRSPVGASRPEGIWLLRKRQPSSCSPPMEPGDRATDRRIGKAKDVDVQWLRRSSRELYAGMDLASFIDRSSDATRAMVTRKACHEMSDNRFWKVVVVINGGSPWRCWPGMRPKVNSVPTPSTPRSIRRVCCRSCFCCSH